jgi:hypothetical protein
MERVGALGYLGWTPKGRASYKEKMTGELNPAWKGGFTILAPYGNYVGLKYVRCPPEFKAMSGKNGYVGEHRLIVARTLGRCLIKSEIVHHINHNPRDNQVENLMLFATNRDHKLFERHGSPPPIWSGLNLPITKEWFGAFEQLRVAS